MVEPGDLAGRTGPDANNVVRILPGHTVTIDDTSAAAYTVAVDGKLAFAPSVNTRLKVTNLQVMAGEMGMGTPGILEVGTAASADRRGRDGGESSSPIRRSAAAWPTR